MSRLGVDGHPVVWLQNQVGLGPLHSGFRLTLNFSWEFDFAASLGRQTSQKLGIKLDLWSL